MKIDRSAQTTSVSTRLVAVCLAPEAGGGFEVREVPRRSPAADEIEIAVEAASVNPIDVRRADWLWAAPAFARESLAISDDAWQ